MKAILTLAGILTASMAALPAWSGHDRNPDVNKPFEEQFDNDAQHPQHDNFGGGSSQSGDRSGDYSADHADSNVDDMLEHQADAVLYQAAKNISRELKRPISWVWLDDRSGVAPHYHFDVVLDNGSTARLQASARTGEISWRNPAILED